MAITWVAGTAASFATATSVAATTPAGIQNDDGLFAFVFARSALTPPTGWTLVASYAGTVSTTVQTLYIYRKDTVTSGNSTTSYTWTQASSSRMGATYAVVRADSAKVRVEVVAQNKVDNIASSWSIANPGVTASRAGCIVLSGATSQLAAATSSSITAPTSMTQWTGAAATNQLGGAYQTRGDGDAGSTANWSFPSTSGTNGLAAISLLIYDGQFADTLAETVAVAEPTFRASFHVFSDTLSDGVGSADNPASFGFSRELGDTVNLPDVTGWVQGGVAADTFRAQAFVAPTKRTGASAADTAGVAETLKAYYSQILRERIGVDELTVSATKYHLTLADLIRTAAALRVGLPVSLSSGVGVHDASVAVVAAYVLERLGLRDVLLPVAKYGQTVADPVRINDALLRFLGGSFADTLGMSDALLPRYLIGRTLAETIGVSDALTPKLLLRLTVADGVKITPTQALKTVFKPRLADAVEISAAHVAPNGTITTWVVNTRTGAVTEYGNYAFNSFAQRGHKYLGASATGLYELNGDDDQGADIIARIKSGWAQFAGSRYSMFKAAYLGMRADGEVFFKVEAGTGESYTYQVVVQDMQTTKVRMGKGLRARYFSFELTTTGQDFDIDSIEFVPIVAQRRV